MALSTHNAADQTGSQQAEGGSAYAPNLQIFVFTLFFTFGGITSLNDVIIPKLRELFTLTYAQAMLVQSAFFAAYFIISLPAASIVQRWGYMRAASIGLLAMMLGCLLFVPASTFATFELFLFALFVLAAGITIVQVTANPLISMLGAPATAHSRLTFAQAFNALGTTVFPYFGSIIILGGLASIDQSTLSGQALVDYRAAETRTVVHTYLGLAAALAVIAGVVWFNRRKLRDVHRREPLLRAFTLLKRPRFALGSLGIFLYVGAEVAIGSLIVNYLMQADVMGLGELSAGKHVPLYWGGALVGRFIGAAVLRFVSPGKVLATVATGATILLVVSSTSAGAAAGWALLAIGLMNAIMFPTIFSLASEGLGDRAAEGSGIICMAIVGGAIIPPLTGHVGDLAGLRTALFVPAACYVLIALYGLFARRSAIAEAAEPVEEEPAFH